MTRKKKTIQDPFAEREALRYTSPIPSREFILKYLKQHGGAATRMDLEMEFGLADEELAEALRRRLRAMVRDGQLMEGRDRQYRVMREEDCVTGYVIGHPDGFGFVVSDEGGEDVFLSAREMQPVFHGDRVLVHVTKTQRSGRREGRLIKVLVHQTERTVGRYIHEKGRRLVMPDNKRMPKDIVIGADDDKGAKPGQIVVVEIIVQPSFRAAPRGRIVEVLGDHMAPGMEIDLAMRAYDIPHTWPAAVLKEVKKFGDVVPKADKKGRKDLTKLPFVTIDGVDARDFDDAVYCEPIKRGGWRLWVAIADVSHYVKPSTALDAEANTRGTSVYFPGRVNPMLPRELSNELCSLNPDVDRLSLVCEMKLDVDGNLEKWEFYPAVIRSHARLTYDQVAGWLDDPTRVDGGKYTQLLPHIKVLHDLYLSLDTHRKTRGALTFETVETQVIFGQGLKIKEIKPLKRNLAHTIIEECMILANIAAARFIAQHKVPCLYRIHASPKKEKLQGLRDFLGELGLSLGGGDDPQPLDFSNLLDSVTGREDAHLIQTVAQRTLQQAVYSPENVGHFGLALPAYAHFTSPIRRYPDLLIHRAICHIVEKTPYAYNDETMASLGEHCSMTERRADEATRDAMDWLKCEYMLDKIGEEFHGVVSSVLGFGMFVELSDVYVEGLVHMTALKDDRYVFDAGKHRLHGQRTGKTYRLGDSVDVKVMRVDLDNRNIDFELVGQEAAPAPSAPASDKKRKKRRKRSPKSK